MNTVSPQKKPGSSIRPGTSQRVGLLATGVPKTPGTVRKAVVSLLFVMLNLALFSHVALLPLPVHRNPDHRSQPQVVARTALAHNLLVLPALPGKPSPAS